VPLFESIFLSEKIRQSEAVGIFPKIQLLFICYNGWQLCLIILAGATDDSTKLIQHGNINWLSLMPRKS